jgi:hypothetical protein
MNLKAANMDTTRQRNDMKTIINSERGSVIVAALMILALLTIMGFAATNMSTTELNVSTNSLLYERAFYTAEAALQHAKETLREPFSEQLEAGGNEEWDFALVDAVDTNSDGKGSYEEGITLFQDLELEGVKYTVTIWNNDDNALCSGTFNDDCDGRIFVRAEAEESVRGGRCSIEELIMGTANGGPTSDYTAQEGAGSGKAYSADDTNPVDMNVNHDGSVDGEGNETIDNNDYISIM